MTRPNRFAVIGIACRFPGVDGPAAYWELLRDGRVAIGAMPAGRWDLDAAGYPDLSTRERGAVLHGGFFDRIDEFDAECFGISAREARQMDPQQRLVLELAAEAFECAGLTRDALRGSDAGVFVGICSNDYQRPQLSAPDLNHGYVHTGTAPSIAANRVSYRFDLHGPSMAIDTACSSSLVAVHLACQALASGEASIALAGGVSLLPSPEMSVAFARTGFLSPDGCRSFAEGADGYTRAEGGALVVLRELEAALAAGDDVWAVIDGSAVNQDGESLGLTAPSRQAQVDVIRRALRRAGRDREEIDYVETHGTGTALGDRIEALALGEALGKGRPPERRLRIGSVKSSLGHLEAAAGVAGLLKVILAMRHGEIPHTARCEPPNPDIAFDALGISLVRQKAAWSSLSGARVAGVSAFGFGGTNCHVIVEAAPEVPPNGGTPALPALVLAASSAPKLRGLAARLALLDPSSYTLDEVCAALATRRNHDGEHRVAIRATRWEDVRHALRVFGDDGTCSAVAQYGVARVSAGSPPCLAFVFGELSSDELPPEWARGLSDEERSIGEQALAASRASGTGASRVAAVLAALGAGRLLARMGCSPEAIVATGTARLVAAVWARELGLGDALALAQKDQAPPAAFAGAVVAIARVPSGADEWWEHLASVDAAEIQMSTWVELGRSPLAREEARCLRGHDGGVIHSVAWIAARLFVRGHTVSWSPLAPGVRNIELPTTPFTRARYWYVDEADAGVSGRQASAALSAKAVPAGSRPEGSRPVGSRKETPAPAQRVPATDARAANGPERMTEIVRRHIAATLRVPLDSVDVDVSILTLGVDSLLSLEIIDAVEDDTGVRLELSSLVAGPTVRELGRVVAATTASVAVEEPNEASEAAGTAAGDAGEDRRLGVSYNQAGLLFVQRSVPASAAYHVAFAFRVRDLDRDALKQSLAAVVARHAELRAVFEDAPGGLVRRIQPLSAAPVVAERTFDDRQSLSDRLAAAAEEPFSLSGGPLYRFEIHALHELPDREACVLLVFHHAVVDFWSLVVIGRDLGASYRSLTAGRTLDLVEPANRYDDFVRWQRDRIAGDVGEQLFGYWRSHLADVSPVLELPTDFSRPPRQSFRGATHDFELDAATTVALRNLAREKGVTLYTVLLALFEVLVARLSNQSSFAVGTLANGRTARGFEDVVGYFVNLTPVRVDIRVDEDFDAHLARVRAAVLGAIEHQDYPFPLLVQRLGLPRDPSRQPLCQVVFALERPPQGDDSIARGIFEENSARIDLGGWDVDPVPVPRRASSFDLVLVMQEDEGKLRAQLEYDTSLFRPETIVRFASYLVTLSRSVLERPGRPLGELPLVTSETSVAEFGATKPLASIRPDVTVWDLFEAEAERAPERIAIVGDDGALTYGELRDRARSLARRLRARVVKPNPIVAVALERSFAFVTAILGVMCAGGAFLPLDPKAPPERRRTILSHARVAVVVAKEATLAELGVSADLGLSLDGGGAREEGETSWTAPRPVDLACVLHTSGSTGTPKVVEIEHRALAHPMQWMTSSFGFGGDDVTLQSSSIGTAASVWELLQPLVSGGRLAVARAGADRERARELVEDVARFGVTVIHGVPRILARLVEAGLLASAQLRLVFSGGDVLTPALRDALLGAPHVRVVNLYGSTEAMIAAVFCELDRNVREDGSPIGRPVPGMTAYVVDDRARLCLPGVPGELVLAGAQLARGYLFDDVETEQRFVPNPFGEGLVYRTGDRAAFGADGVLRYLGRVDRQMTLRGVRVDPEEVEACLRRHPSVLDAAATMEGGGRRARLLAFVVVREGDPMDARALREHAARFLPAAIVPSRFLILSALPLLASGKVDLRALAAMAHEALAAKSDEHPASPTEAAILAAFRDVLGAADIGVDDDFFEFGGHSLLAMALAVRVSAIVGREVLAPTVFTAPSARALTRTLAKAPPEDAPSVAPLSDGRPRRMFFVEPPGARPTTYAALSSMLRGTSMSRIGLAHRPAPNEPQTIVDLASAHLRALRSAQPEGPYLLGGWSLGGTIALEMACQLRAAGAAVELVLVDTVAFHTWTVGAEEARRLFLESYVAECRAAGGVGEELAARLHAAIANERPIDREREPEAAALEELFIEASALFEVARGYRPACFDGRALLIRPTHGYADRASWEGTLSGELSVTEVTGTHDSVLLPPLVEKAAAAIDEWLFQ
jgi:amino acid adenylation domain-containing protein